jgi:hypothetical protein
MASVDVGIGAFPSFGELAELAMTWGRNAVWAPDPVTQIVTNIVIIIAAVVSSAVTLGATLFIALIGVTFLGVGIARLIIGALLSAT